MAGQILKHRRFIGTVMSTHGIAQCKQFGHGKWPCLDKRVWGGLPLRQYSNF